MNIVTKCVLWGAGIMLVVSGIGAILGPSPINILFAPILTITSIPLQIAISIIPGLDTIAAGGIYGVEGSFINYGFYALLVGWNVFVGCLVGWIVGVTLRNKSRHSRA